MRRLFWIVAIPVWLVSAAFLFGALVSFLDAPNYAAKNLRIKGAIERRAKFVDASLQADGEFPSEKKFEEASKQLDREPWVFELRTRRPASDEGFDFPPWPLGTRHYAISMWRGE